MLFRNILAAVLSAGLVSTLPAYVPYRLLVLLSRVCKLIKFRREPLSTRSVDFNWGSQKVRGLNIGGWLVLEPWITPSIFQALDQSLGIVDEYTLTERLGTDAAYSILKPHVSLRPSQNSQAEVANSLHSGIAGAHSMTFRRSPTLDSTQFGYQSDTGHTLSTAANHTLKVLRRILMLQLTGLGVLG